MIDLRVLAPDDWRVWRSLRLAALAEAPEAFASRLADWEGDGDREKRWRSRLAMPGAHNLVAELAGRPVGMASGVPASDPQARELIAMWVSPGARGAGVGDALIAAVTRWARAEGASELRLAVYSHNLAAAALYRRNGFADSVPPGPERVGERVMAKPL
ncbi:MULTISPECIES: GNAT family N-acetyltransferase [Glycomyces]|uniref:GNAT family N-acetyltransferase n=2 Tax=Glycomyces TaxID=58113 RepID=A0A9X3PQB1_9ACTN|nr:GNAT family N-acetyltransferase [Glycomyces lechevalierae]MDA1388039.1 GNAT family N-acetyltransferase [Glycomyces lechevalierae]MDR7338790.1 GNAT superfamily N-acetyltransferase [Glycomyces lechevalierae]